jgi:hypothetical protein
LLFCCRSGYLHFLIAIFVHARLRMKTYQSRKHGIHGKIFYILCIQCFRD